MTQRAGFVNLLGVVISIIIVKSKMYICQEKILEESVTDLVSTMIKVGVICGMNYLFQMKQKSVTIKYKFNSFGHNFKRYDNK